MSRRDLWIGLLALVGVISYVAVSAVVHEVGFPLDDAWIHQTYARNLAERREWAFIPGEPSVASTSPFYTVLLTLGYGLNIPFFTWTFGLGVLTLAGAGWVSTRLATILYPDVPSVDVWTGLTVVLTWHLVWAASSGMETMLFSTFSLAVVWLGWREMNMEHTSKPAGFRRGFVLGLVGALATLTRPEGAGLIGLVGAAVVLARPFGEYRANWSAYLAWGGGLLSGWLISIAPYVALNYDIEGTLLPNTSAAKQAENAPARALPLWERYGRMILPLSAGGQLLLSPGIVVGMGIVAGQIRRTRRSLLLGLPFVWALTLISAYAIWLPAWYQHGRYVIPVLPHLLLYGVGGTLVIIRRGGRNASQRVLTRSLGLSCVLIVPAFWVIGAQQYARDVRIINTEMVDTARWVDENLPPEELLAVHDIGALGYYAPRPILDLAGLVSPEVVPIIRDHEAVMLLMCERGAQYLMVLPDQRPATPDDQRLGTDTEYDPESGLYVVKPLFRTDAPYSPAAGSGNMMIYALNWANSCDP